MSGQHFLCLVRGGQGTVLLDHLRPCRPELIGTPSQGYRRKCNGYTFEGVPDFQGPQVRPGDWSFGDQRRGRSLVEGRPIGFVAGDGSTELTGRGAVAGYLAPK
jgi:hypothetical protein